MGGKDVAAMLATRATAAAQPGVRQAAVTKGWTSVRGTQGSSDSTYLAVQVNAGAAGVKDDALCERVAAALLQRNAAEVDAVYGYDIGIASGWQSRRVALSPAQWREQRH